MQPTEAQVREELSEAWSMVKIFAGWTVGWVLRKLATGALYALGGYTALRLIGIV